MTNRDCEGSNPEYNIFMPANISFEISTSLADIFRLLGQPVRIQILIILARQEACVCHLEAALGLRQASISQHLMSLRKKGLVQARRDGRNIFYHLVHPEIRDILHQIASIVGLQIGAVEDLSIRPLLNCPCPQCHPEITSEYSCKKLHPTKNQ